MLATGVEKQFGDVGADGFDECPSSVDVTLVGEELVVVHAVHLNREPVGPWADRPLAGDRQARLVQQCTLHAGAGLSQSLRGHHAHGDAGVHEVGRKAGERAFDPLGERCITDALHDGEPLFEPGGNLSVIEIGGVHRVPTSLEPPGQSLHPVGEAENVMEQNNLSHLAIVQVSDICLQDEW